MRSRLLALAGLFLWVCVFTTGASAQRQLQLYATIVDGNGAPAGTVTPEDVKVQENGADLKILKVEPIEWTTKVQILLDNGSGIGSANLNQLRNGLRGLLEALPLGLEVTIVTTAPQPRFLVRATTDRLQQLAGIDRLAPDSTVGRFVESLGEALQRFAKDKTDFFGVIVSLGTTAGDNRVLDRDINQIFERVQKRPTTVHVVMVSAVSRRIGERRCRPDGNRDAGRQDHQRPLREHRGREPHRNAAAGNRRADCEGLPGPEQAVPHHRRTRRRKLR